MKIAAAKSRPECRSCRETNEGRQMKAGAAKSRPEWRRETNEGRSSQKQARMEITKETNEGRHSQHFPPNHNTYGSLRNEITREQKGEKHPNQVEGRQRKTCMETGLKIMREPNPVKEDKE